jgi:hypothetical protein
VLAGFLGNSLARNTGESAQPPEQSGSQPPAGNLEERLDLVLQRLERIESVLEQLVQQRTVKDWYSTAEVAKHLERAEYTVREWCRQGRIRAKKKPCGRGKGGEWLVSHEELTRLKNEGLFPFPRPA